MTYDSVPNILTGYFYDHTVPFSDFLKEAYYSQGSVPKVLRDEGFEVDYFPYSDNIYIDESVISNTKARIGIDRSTIVNIYDVALFRYVPDVLKRYIYNDGEWFLKNIVPGKSVKPSIVINSGEPVNAPLIIFDDKALTLSDVAFANNMMNSSKTIEGQSIFKFYRLNGCHIPYLLNEELRYEKMGTDGYRRQARASLRIVEIFLDELKSLEVFDNSMIFVIGDHGKPGTSKFEMQSSANPLFLVKKFNICKGEMTISNAPVSLSDIPETIFSELGIKSNGRGISI